MEALFHIFIFIFIVCFAVFDYNFSLIKPKTIVSVIKDRECVLCGRKTDWSLCDVCVLIAQK